MIPKSLLSLLMVVAATFSVAATDLLFVEDFSILPGESAMVELQMESEEQLTAFQTDLYLPEGLTVDVQSITLTDRKSSDHTLITSVLVNGAVRLMSYSMGVQPYDGNTGAVVTFRVEASEDMSFPATFVLKNSRLTTVSGQKIVLDNGSSTVSAAKRGDVNGDGIVTITDVTALINKLLTGEAAATYAAVNDVNADHNVTITDVTFLINNLLSGTAN